MKHLFIFALIIAAASLTTAQTKTVTNGDLEQFRQKRLKAEKDYRENYEKLGFPSPEELDRQNEQSKRDLAELSRRIEAENARKESLEQSARNNALLEEINLVNAQTFYLSRQANRRSNRNYIYSFGYAPYFYRHRRIVDPNYIQPLPNLANYQILINQYPYRNNRRAPNSYRRHFYQQN